MSIDSLRRILDGLDEDQQQAVLADPGPVRIVAGAGTGKTRTLTHRIAYHHHLGTAPGRTVLAVTHSKKAAGEMSDRLAVMGTRNIQARTFHSAARRQLNYFWSQTRLPGAGVNVIQDGAVYSLLRPSLARVLGGRASDLPAEVVRDVRAEVSWAKVRGHSPSDYVQAAAEAGRSVAGVPPVGVASAFRAYESVRTANAVLDFDDLLIECAALLESNDHVAASVQRAYRHLLVDEYQDTDPAQQRLLDAWLGSNTSLCVVGDPRQTIYSFKGAEPSLLTQFADRYPDAVTVNLVRDYRSGPQIVNLANRIMTDTTANGGANDELIGLGTKGPSPQVTPYPTELAEAAALAQQAAALIAAGTDAAQIAVLVRFTAQTLALTAALSDAGVRTSSGGEDYFSRPEIVAALRALGRISADEPGLDTHSALLRAAAASGYDPQEEVTGAGSVAERHEALAALVELGATLIERGHTTAAAAHADLLHRSEDEHSPTVGRAVTVSTIHKAKGLEWDVVFLPRMTDGSLPSTYAKTPAAKDEERRLLYVAVTRARRALYVSFATDATTAEPTGRRPTPHCCDQLPP